MREEARKGSGAESVGCLPVPCRILNIFLNKWGIKVGSGGTEALERSVTLGQ